MAQGSIRIVQNENFESVPQGPAGKHVASIIHLTDLHLLLSPEMDPLSGIETLARTKLMRTLSTPIPILNRVVNEGVAVADRPSYVWLRTNFRRAYLAERSRGAALPILVAQTGDVDAYGMIANTDHRGYEWLDRHLRVHIDNDDHAEWLDVFGNHDIWSGYWPVDAIRNQPGSLTLMEDYPAPERFGKTWACRDWLKNPLPESPLEVYRINSVLEENLEGSVMARGRLGPHPRRPNEDDGPAALDVLWRQVGESTDDRAVRILLSHHPVLPPKSKGDNASNGEALAAANAERLAAAASRLHLLVAGHTHRLDAQAFDEAGFGQLVAETPTQAMFNTQRRSFSVYRIRLVETGNERRLNVGLVRYVNGTAGDCKPTKEVEVLSGIVT